MVFIHEVGFVWRQLELAFFGAVTLVAALLFLEGKMENSTQKIKFPVGAILMIAYAIWGILSLFVLDNHI